MSTDTDEDKHGIDPRLKGSAGNAGLAARRAMFHHAKGPAHMLDALGVEHPDYDFDTENAHEYPTTKVIEDTRVHLHQDVREDMDDGFGDFGASDEDEEDVIWTVVDLTDGTVTLKVVGEWSQKREPTYEEFAEDYEPITLEVQRSEYDPVEEVPRFGY